MNTQSFGHGLIIQSFLTLKVKQFFSESQNQPVLNEMSSSAGWRGRDLSSMARAITGGFLALLSNSAVQKGDAELRQMFCCSSSPVVRLFIPHFAHGL